MDGVLSEGDMVKVKLIGLDNKTGKFKLSRKVLMPKPEGARPDGPRPGGGREGRPEIRPQRQENKE
jgi:polyribonucleotide nucleotidyltransferase